MSIHKKLNEIQSALKVPKNQVNKFGGYNYRSLEDIQEAVKKLLSKHGCTLVISDDIKVICDRVYVEATASLHDSDSSGVVSVKAFAREPIQKKGMDESQITGAASSYARKYALNGLFAIDDTKDADATNDHGKSDKGEQPPEKQPKALPDVLKAHNINKAAFYKMFGIDSPEKAAAAFSDKAGLSELIDQFKNADNDKI